jgi:hypothetical protein
MTGFSGKGDGQSFIPHEESPCAFQAGSNAFVSLLQHRPAPMTGSPVQTKPGMLTGRLTYPLTLAISPVT